VIYYHPGADHPYPSGGVRTHYDHVERLNEAGIPAAILHITPGFKPPWFTSPAPVVYAPDVELGPNDTLVLNEIMGPGATEITPTIRKVTFAQNVHYTWRGWPVPASGPHPYAHPEFVATLVLTEYERAFFNWAFPGHPVHVTPHGYDVERFQPRTKRKQIAYMPRKHADEAQQVFGYLAARGDLAGWDVVAIDGLTEDQTAAVLGESMIFVPFGYPEGGTKPPFEAMLSGCVTIGYGGFASDADMQRCGGYVTPSGDTCTLTRRLAELLAFKPFETLVAEGQQCRDWTRRRFNRDIERDAVVRAWRAIGV
jgi:glycosyltransferase involved in cell wall biosynthesis